MITLVKLSPTEFRWTISLKLKKRKTNCYFRSLVLKTMVLCVSSYVSQFDLTSSLCLQCFSVLPVVILVTYVLIQLRDTYIGQSDLLISDLSDLRHRSSLPIEWLAITIECLLWVIVNVHVADSYHITDNTHCFSRMYSYKLSSNPNSIKLEC